MNPAKLSPDPSVSVSNRENHPRSDGHVAVASVCIVALSILLAVGFSALGLLERANRQVAAWVMVPKGPNSLPGEDFPNQLPVWAVWAATVVATVFVSVAILSTPGWERRLLLWFASLLLVAAWAPVLSLAAFAPEISAVFVATSWAGLCACVYAANHRMPCDSPKSQPLP